jgi:hypothetical protein
MHEQPVVFKNGLVDPDSLLEFMDNCHCDDLVASSPNDHKEEYHHLYFPRRAYKNNWADITLRKLRNSRYNLIGMLSCQEDYYHQRTIEEVPQEQIDKKAAKRYLEESQWLTNYAATSWLIAETQRNLDYTKTSSRAKRISLAARLAILDEMRHYDLEQLGKIEVISHSIVAGALSKYLKQRFEPKMQDLLKQHMSGNGRVIPTKIYGSRALRNIAELRLKKKVESQSVIIQKLVFKPMAEIA